MIGALSYTGWLGLQDDWCIELHRKVGSTDVWSMWKGLGHTSYGCSCMEHVEGFGAHIIWMLLYVIGSVLVVSW